MRISDWSSDVCSSDLLHPAARIAHAMEDCLVAAQEGRLLLQADDIDALLLGTDLLQRVATPGAELGGEIDDLVVRLSNSPAVTIGRASCRERVWQHV